MGVLYIIALSTPQVFSRMIWYVGLKRRLQKLKQNAVPPSPDRAMVGTVQESKIDTNLIRAVGTTIRAIIDLRPPLKILKGFGAPLVGIAATGERGEVPPQVFATPKLSKEITKNDNYCASSVQDL